MPATWPPVDVRRFGRTRTSAVSTTITTDDYTVRMNATGGPLTATLPPAASCYDGTVCVGQIFEVRKADPSANPVTVTPEPGETINGNPSCVLNGSGDSVTLQSYGDGWDIL